ncbi:MAG: hypothetical protein JWP35_2828 [Caulobacter sp.]|nr:hypothetical protein [Caulobacter sp.]
MDEELARRVIAVATRSADDLGGLILPLKEACEEDLYAALLMGIGSSIYEILEKVRGPIFERFPDLKAEHERGSRGEPG